MTHGHPSNRQTVHDNDRFDHRLSYLETVCKLLEGEKDITRMNSNTAYDMHLSKSYIAIYMLFLPRRII